MPKIYLIVDGEYSDWEILGYSTNKDNAEKYCVLKQAEHSWYEPYILMAECIDERAEASNIKVLYRHEVVFRYKNGNWKMDDEPDRYELYSGDIKPNLIKYGAGAYNERWIDVNVNQNKFSRKKAEKIAQDLLYQYLIMADEVGWEKATAQMNEMLETRRDAKEG